MPRVHPNPVHQAAANRCAAAQPQLHRTDRTCAASTIHTQGFTHCCPLGPRLLPPLTGPRQAPSHPDCVLPLAIRSYTACRVNGLLARAAPP
jgi:hypothetical protein